jgi:hypothetical protein
MRPCAQPSAARRIRLVLARHAADLPLIDGLAGLRPDLDVAEGSPVAGALGAMVAYDGATRVGPAEEPVIILPSGVA